MYYGATPAQSDGGGSKPVLLFVHGAGGVAADWWVTNDMYTDAWSAGYRTAFVELTPLNTTTGATLPEADAFSNGITVSHQIITVTQHFGVPWLDIIGHSKGGVDAQTAIAYDGAYVHVHNLITLATPHRGTPLADLVCYQNPSIAQLIGLGTGPGLCGSPYSVTNPTSNTVGGLTVADMSAFRAATDVLTSTAAVTYFVAGGADWQDNPPNPLVQLGGQLLGQGLLGVPALDPRNDNDGLVPVESACMLPGAHYLFVRPYNHFNILLGDNAWAWINLAEEGAASVNRSSYTAPNNGTNGGPGPSQCAFYGTTLPATGTMTALNGGGIMKSGVLPADNTSAVNLPVEAKAQLVGLHLLVSGPTVSASLIDPSGSAHALPEPSKTGADNAIFGNSWLINYQMARVMKGAWRLKLRAPARSAYLLDMAIESPLQVTLAGVRDGELVRPGQTITLQAAVHDSFGAAHIEKMSLHITGSGYSPIRTTRSSALFRAPMTPGSMILGVSVTGKDAGGNTFERTFIRSVAVVMPARQLDPMHHG